MNHLINARDYNGEVMMNLVLRFYPQKVNQERYRQSMMDKYEGHIIKMNSFEQMMGATTNDQHYKLVDPNAVASYV